MLHYAGLQLSLQKGMSVFEVLNRLCQPHAAAVDVSQMAPDACIWATECYAMHLCKQLLIQTVGNLHLKKIKQIKLLLIICFISSSTCSRSGLKDIFKFHIWSTSRKELIVAYIQENREEIGLFLILIHFHYCF